jgi:hypothetical protein
MTSTSHEEHGRPQTAPSTAGGIAAFSEASPRPLMPKSVARGFIICVFLFLLLVQAGYLVRVGNGLPPPGMGDSHSEADLIRSADAYFKDGLTSHHGLPRILYGYGKRFPTNGAVADHLDANGLVPLKFRQGFPPDQANPDDWVYTHYPPGPNLLGGALAHLFGFNHIWLWRLLPISLGFLAMTIFFRTLARAFGADRAGLIVAACIVLPMVVFYLPGLHFQGYAFELLLLQLSLLIRIFWSPDGLRSWHGPVFFLLGFMQGWLSFDLFFVVTLLAWPLWLLRRAEGVQPPVRRLLLMMVLPLAGFALAHVLHLLQVAVELGGLRIAIEEFRRTAGERADQPGMVVLPQTLQALLGSKTASLGYFGSLALSGYYYLREVLILRGLQFGPFMFLALLAALPVAAFRTTQVAVMTRGKGRRIFCSLSWPGPKGILPVLGAALLVSSLWLLVMPAHVVGNSHITVRQLFVLYFFLVVTVVRSISVSEERSASAGTMVAPKS